MAELMLARGSSAVTGKRLVVSVALVLLAAAWWGVLTRSWWVATIGAVMAGLPLWWMPSERERSWTRFAGAMTQIGTVAAIYLLLFRRGS